MLKILSLASFAATALVVVASTAPAAAQVGSPIVCPAHYEQIGSGLCFKTANGDIVFAEVPVAPRYTSADCRRGYEHMSDNLCIHPKWGDVVFVNERPTVATAICRGGFEFLVNGLCFNRASGDIVFSEVKTGTTLAAVQK